MTCPNIVKKSIMETVYIASKSEEKLQATTTAWCSERVLPTKFLQHASASGVSEQPVDDEIKLGALNRIANIECHANQDDFLVAYESGIFVDKGSPDQSLEITLCAIKIGGKTVTAWSPGRQYPYSVILNAIEDGVTDLKSHNELVKQWYKSHPDVVSQQTRVEAMTKACEDCLKQL